MEKVHRRIHTDTTIPKSRRKKKDTGFTSVSSHVTYVLREIVAEEEEPVTEEPLTGEDEERVEARLSALGYIDDEGGKTRA